MEATASVVPEVRRVAQARQRLPQIRQLTLETEVAVGEVARVEAVSSAAYVLVAKMEPLEHPVQLLFATPQQQTLQWTLQQTLTQF
jgi:hypothetical protein